MSYTHMKFSPLDQVFIQTPAALLLGVVVEGRIVKRHGADTVTYLVRHLDNVATIAEMVCGEDQLGERNHYRYLSNPAADWLDGIGKPAAQFCDDFVSHVTGLSDTPDHESVSPRLVTTVGG